jgi:hypothetical protein
MTEADLAFETCIILKYPWQFNVPQKFVKKNVLENYTHKPGWIFDNMSEQI